MKYMKQANLASLDLNLMVVLDALLEHSHVGRAAAKVGLSQPAASHALRRLREIFGDPLLVRSGLRMQPTPRAEALRTPLAEALERMREILRAKEFEPSKSTREFTIMVPDQLIAVLLAPLVSRIAEVAPLVRLDVLPWRAAAQWKGASAGSFDVFIGCETAGTEGFRRRLLLRDTEALAVRKTHSWRARLSKRRWFEEARHVAVIAPGKQEDPIDEWLRGEGIKRRIALVVPGYLAALQVAASSDLVAFVPRLLIQSQQPASPIAIVAPPLDPGWFDEFLFFPARTETDPASIWFRELILALAATITGDSPRGRIAIPRT
jgi:DNA-binding transcriptional LysR family regulator